MICCHTKNLSKLAEEDLFGQKYYVKCTKVFHPQTLTKLTKFSFYTMNHFGNQRSQINQKHNHFIVQLAQLSKEDLGYQNVNKALSNQVNSLSCLYTIYIYMKLLLHIDASNYSQSVGLQRQICQPFLHAKQQNSNCKIASITNKSNNLNCFRVQATSII